jgi:uncharacterized protein (DUF433 family)
MRWEDYIERVPGVMLGKPVFKGTRFTVEFLLERLADGASEEELLANHPTLTRDHIRAALGYAAAMIRNDEAVLNV